MGRRLATFGWGMRIAGIAVLITGVIGLAIAMMVPSVVSGGVLRFTDADIQWFEGSFRNHFEFSTR